VRVGIIGTGAIAQKHAQVYRNIGYRLTVCTDSNRANGERFAAEYGCQFLPGYEEVCSHPEVDYVDVCTFPDFRLQPLEACARSGKAIQVQKPIATNLETARRMIEIASEAGIVFGVCSQRRFDDSTRFVKKAITQGRLGKILQADAYVKWWRDEDYYSRPIKGSWAVEGGGALINQAVHQVDILQYLVGEVGELFGYWQIAARHKIESEDVVCAVLKYRNGATGVLQASTAFLPGFPERVEIHGTKGTCILTADRLTAWDVPNDHGERAPVQHDVMSGSSDPMAISLTPFERQFLDFGEAVRKKSQPLVSGEEGLKALEIVLGVYQSCRTGERVVIEPLGGEPNR
jgi:UDP-N-acetyl-2-amino-2-deoxyglucuronate dehydrogenase